MTNSDPCEIEIFHDVEQRTLYLHLETVHDGAMLCKLCEILNENIPLAEAHKAWQHQEYQYAKALLFMFSVCHIMVLMHPTQTFDVSYIRLFKLVASTRLLY
ncbi:partial [Paramuricea clavata]|uniref:Nonsense-mediated mRNA decay factor SMG8 n=1 Tax=Paramuricea clavata TaxID=317549 RepID=A0A6S7K542_PARCT|nr:partial [Paramuricea clavata]